MPNKTSGDGKITGRFRMALEALVTTADSGDPNVKAKGDVIVIALQGYEWGGEENGFTNQVVEWLASDADDKAIEAGLVARQDAGEVNPFVVYPFAEYDNDGNMVRMSTKFVDIDTLPNAGDVKRNDVFTGKVLAKGVTRKKRSDR